MEILLLELTPIGRKNFSGRPAVDRQLIGGYGWGRTPFKSFGSGLNLKAVLFFMFLGAVAAFLRKYIMFTAEQKRRR